MGLFGVGDGLRGMVVHVSFSSMEGAGGEFVVGVDVTLLIMLAVLGFEVDMLDGWRLGIAVSMRSGQCWMVSLDTSLLRVMYEMA